MHQHLTVIQLARQTALKKFALLIQRMAQHAGQALEQALSARSSVIDFAAYNAARHFLRKSGEEMLEKIESHYRQKLEQAIHAMTSNERVNVGQFTAANLTLIDDQTINRQIEVGRLVIQLSASCADSLSQVNLIMSQILDKAEVKEKDNPFRPELIAHALYDVLCAMVEHENVRECLLINVTNSLATSLPEYYTELSEVFKAGGINPKLAARPTSKNPYRGSQPNKSANDSHQTNQNAPELIHSTGNVAGGISRAGAGSTITIPSTMLPALERLLSAVQASGQSYGPASDQTPTGGSGAATGNPMIGFQQLLEAISSGSNLSQGGAGIGINPASAALLTRLQEFQNMAASGRGADGLPATQGNQLFAIGNQLGGDIASPSERMTMELIAMIFELILRDDQLPEAMRAEIGQLQIPFLKSAMQDATTLQMADHPTRQLLNHMGMVSAEMPAGTALGQEVGTEFRRIGNSILSEFHTDSGIFLTRLNELKKFMDEEIRRVDDVSKRSIEAIEEVQNNTYLTYGITSSIREVLIPLNLDQRIVDFCLNTWVHVLAKASVKIKKAKGDNAPTTRAKLELFFRALPDLVWSAQEKTSTEDRVALIGLLPKLVKVIGSGLKGMQIPEDEAKQKLDQLLAVHAQVLANTDAVATKNAPTLAELRQMFTVEAIQEAATVSKAIAPLSLDTEKIYAAFTKRSIAANLEIVPPGEYADDVEDEWLAEMKIGTRIESKMDGSYQFGRLIWLGQQQSLFMFRLDRSPEILVYCPASLSRALRNGAITFVETAPTFERAVETLLREAELLKSMGAPPTPAL
jgi:hypothetical protein